jgi:monoamine oxidase
MKIILKFKKRPWPKHLQGLIMSCDSCPVPEMWFREVAPSSEHEKLLTLGDDVYLDSDEVDAAAVATAFLTADYADKLLAMPEEDMYRVVLAQMDEVFSHLAPDHMSAYPNEGDETPSSLPSPSSVFIKAMYFDWKQCPYIGGGYSCARVGWNMDIASAIADGITEGRAGAIFFAGEATNVSQPGGTAHAALETGFRAADEVSSYLDMYYD